MNVLEKLKKMTDAQKGVKKEEPKEEVKEAPPAPAPAVLAPDAASRVSTPEEVAEANGEGPAEETTEEAKPKRGRKPKALVAAEAAVAEAKEEVKETPPAKPSETLVTDPGESKTVVFDCKVKTIYVNCLPVKGPSNVVSLSDLMPDLAEYAAAAYNDSNPGKTPVADFRLIPYSAAGYLALAVRMNLGKFPEVMFVDSSAPGAAVVLEELSRIATTIIRAVR